MKNTLFKYLSFGLLGLITLILMSATVIEKFCGSAFVGEHIYTSEWMIILWGVAAHFALFYILRSRLYVQYATFALHFLHRYAEVEYLYLLSRLMLYPAVFLLAAGIFIGAVWANVSWGRYWGWDPKEVWALVTMIIYSYGLHVRNFPLFGRPLLFHIFCIVAFITVIVTYFGVNFFLGGMHSYA